MTQGTGPQSCAISPSVQSEGSCAQISIEQRDLGLLPSLRDYPERDRGSENQGDQVCPKGSQEETRMEGTRPLDPFTHDLITGLPTRSLLPAQLASALAEARCSDCGVGVLCLDLDHFEALNDRLGYPAGDHLLWVVAQRLRAARPEQDAIIRYGGDEFVVICPDLTHPAEADAIARQLRGVVAQPVTLTPQEVHVTCSIGVSYAPRDGNHSTTLLQHATSSASSEGAAPAWSA